MKTIFKKIIIIFALALSIVTISCNDYLDKQPLTDFTDKNYWTSEQNVRAYSWEFYNMFYGYGRGGSQYGEFYWQQFGDSNYEMKFTEDLLNSSFLGFPTGVYTSNNMWRNYYAQIRKANLLLLRLSEMTSLTDVTKSHWTGVAKFFRAMNYFSLLSSWGGVPMPLEYYGPDEIDDIYLPRSERKIVADQIIKDLQEAASEMKSSDGLCAVNKYCAYALLSRVALFEGTFRKYHQSGDYTTYLQISENASKEIMNSGNYTLASTFKSKYNSDNLQGNPEIILYKHYEKNVMMHTTQAYTHCSAPALHGLTKFIVDNYSCSDGLPISQSPLYKGDKGIENVMANRDKRFTDVIFDELGYYGKPYADLLVSSTGYVTSIYDNPEKDIKDSDITGDARNYIDAPIYTISEIYLNFAEAKAELGTLTQTDLDNTVNLLRKRAGIADLILNGNNVMASGIIIDDHRRTATIEAQTKGGIVSPILWEIRKERRAEFIGWLQIRHLDMDRWAKGEYMSTDLNPDVMLGAWIGSVPVGSTVKVNSEGYIDNYPSNSRKFEDRYYLDPIPNDEIILYKDKGITLEQNPGWN